MNRAKYFAFLVLSLLPLEPITLAEGVYCAAGDSTNTKSSAQPTTSIGGYGNAFYQRDVDNKTAMMDLERVVLFVGHEFSSRTSFFSELEMEDAKVSGGEDGGEISFEQAYLQIRIDPTHSISAGLFLPRIGILNENHLPTEFNGNERNQVETFIIPSTWRELGIGFYGSLSSVPASYSIALVNGLSSAMFEHGSGIREGRFEGRNASANNLALTGSMRFFLQNTVIGVSGYYGGSVGLSPRQADSLQLESGIFGTPVIVGESHLEYESEGFNLKVLGTTVSIPKASDINRAYANNTPLLEYGAYLEIGCDLFQNIYRVAGQQLIAFLRYETLDMNAEIPSNGILDGTLKQRHIVCGLNYLPMNNVVVKVDVRFAHTGNQNPALILNPSPVAVPYNVDNTFFNLGLGFSF